MSLVKTAILLKAGEHCSFNYLSEWGNKKGSSIFGAALFLVFCFILSYAIGQANPQATSTNFMHSPLLMSGLMKTLLKTFTL